MSSWVVLLHIMCIFLSFFGILDLKLSIVLFTVFFIKLFTKQSTPKTFTVYQDIAIPLLTEFLAEFLTFSGHDSIKDCMGGLFFCLGQFKIVSPVRISLGQIYVGICLYKFVPDLFSWGTVSNTTPANIS